MFADDTELHFNHGDLSVVQHTLQANIEIVSSCQRLTKCCKINMCIYVIWLLTELAAWWESFTCVWIYLRVHDT